MSDPTKAPDDKKLRELILFIAQRSADDVHYGYTKLNKLLFFSDFSAYAALGTSITGHAYQRLPRGPAPKQMKPIVDRMVDDRVLAIQEEEYHGQTQKRPVALRAANLKPFSAEEIAVVTGVLETMRKKNAKGISTLSHRFAGWKLAKERELIPYEVALVQFKKPRKRDLQRALDMGDELTSLRAGSR